MTEQCGDREPVGEPANHRRFGKGADEADRGVGVLEIFGADEDHRHHDQHAVATTRMLELLAGMATPTPRFIGGWTRPVSICGETLSVMTFKWRHGAKVATVTRHSAGCGAGSPCGLVSSPLR